MVMLFEMSRHVIVTVFSIGLASAKCLPAPISLPITNVSNVNQGLTNRGVWASIGHPPQNFSFYVNLASNNSFVYNKTTNTCDGRSDIGCATVHGGWYSPKDSTTYISKGSVIAAGANPQDLWNVSDSTWDWMTENITLGSNATLANFPLAVSTEGRNDQDYSPLPMLGLGPGSDLLAALAKANLTASNAFSYFYGLTGIDVPVNTPGKLVLGGFDAAQVVNSQPSNFTSTRSDGCPSGYVVNIQDMQLKFPNGTTTSIFPAAKSRILQACVDLTFPGIMTLPYDPYYQAFINITGMSCPGRTFGTDFYDMLCDINSPAPPLFQGSLAFTFQSGSGMPVEIPNNQLLISNFANNAQDGTWSVNASQKELAINSIQNISANDFPYLGRGFFSSAMLLAFPEMHQFSIWPVNSPTNNSNIVAIDDQGNIADSICPSNTTSQYPADTATPSATPRVSSSPASTSGTSAGVIAGAVVGTVAGMALIAAAIVFLVIRKKKQRSARATTQVNVVFPNKTPTPPMSTKQFNLPPQELIGIQEPAEMDTTARHTGPVEMPAEVWTYTHAR